MSFEEKADDMLTYDEGESLTPYLDGGSLWTIGKGHLIGTDLKLLRISKETSQQIFREDLSLHLTEAKKFFGADWNRFTELQQLGLLNLIFNLGIVKFSKFEPTISLMRAGKWQEAGERILRTPYARQVKSRATRVVKLLNNEWPKEYG